MTVAQFRHLLSTLGYRMAAEKLPLERNSDMTAHAAAWLAWKANPQRCPTALEIAGAPVITTLVRE